MPIVNVKGFENCICHHPELVNLYECEIGEGTKIGTFVEIGRGVVIGRQCKIESHAFIPEGVRIGNFVFIGPGAIFCNVKYPMTGEKYHFTTVRDGAVVGAGAVILPGLVIGEKAIIGAGAVVTKNVDSGITVIGNPAMPLIQYCKCKDPTPCSIIDFKKNYYGPIECDYCGLPIKNYPIKIIRNQCEDYEAS